MNEFRVGPSAILSLHLQTHKVGKTPQCMYLYMHCNVYTQCIYEKILPNVYSFIEMYIPNVY